MAADKALRKIGISFGTLTLAVTLLAVFVTAAGADPGKDESGKRGLRGDRDRFEERQVRGIPRLNQETTQPFSCSDACVVKGLRCIQ